MYRAFLDPVHGRYDLFERHVRHFASLRSALVGGGRVEPIKRIIHWSDLPSLQWPAL